MSYFTLVPVMTLAEQTGLSRLLDEKVHIAEPRIESGAANPSPKLVTVVAGMCVGADCIDDIDAVRSGGMTTLYDSVYTLSTVGTLLREFTFGHARQLKSVLREHLMALCERVDLLPGQEVESSDIPGGSPSRTDAAQVWSLRDAPPASSAPLWTGTPSD